MPQFLKNTPNLFVADVSRSLAFYVDVLGFSRGFHVPDAPPFVFASAISGAVEIFFNDLAAALKDHPEYAGRTAATLGNSMFIEVDAADALHDRVKGRAKVVMPLITQWYGMREFSIEDPDGFLITFAQRVAAS
jgi:catechol 2,3-dioxygenase-like lactoylglutathione lyase family enzyme